MIVKLDFTVYFQFLIWKSINGCDFWIFTIMKSIIMNIEIGFHNH